MLFMIINHFFVDGAQHICLAWGVCHPRQDLSYITCEECIEGMEWVQAYMTDPLWVAEYTLYLEQVGTRARNQPSRRYHNHGEGPKWSLLLVDESIHEIGRLTPR